MLKKTLFTALVLAGRRESAGEPPLAAGATHRALLDVRGVPMLVRVLRALRGSPSVGQIAVSIDDASTLLGVPEATGISLHLSLASPSLSVLDFLAQQPLDEPVLVVTADHALLTPEMVEHFSALSLAADCDAVVGLVEEERLREAWPETTRTYLRFREGGYSGANLFALRGEGARRAAAFWVRAEQFRKSPWRLVSSFGPVSLALFLLRRLTLEAALERASHAMGARVSAVRMPFAEAAIDVDRQSDLVLVSRILAGREAAEQA